MPKSIFRQNFDISIHGRDTTTSGFGNRQTPLLEFYFRSRLLPNYCHGHVILHLPTEFHPNRTTHGEVMTSSIFQDGVPLHDVAKNLLPALSLVRHSFKIVEMYLYTKFQWNISICGEILLLPVSENKRPLVGILLPVYTLAIHIALRWRLL